MNHAATALTAALMTILCQAGSAQQVSLGEPIVLELGGVPFVSQIAATDLNGDTTADLAVFDGAFNTISFLHHQSGTYELAQQLDVEGIGFAPRLVARDLNDDAREDIFFSTGGDVPMLAFMQQDDGAFNSTHSGIMGTFYFPRFSFGDLNGDAFPDIVTAAPIGSHIGNGDGTFTTVSSVPMTSGMSREPVAMDVLGDAFDDLVILGDVPGVMRTYENLGAGQLAPETTTPIDTLPALDTGDINNDGRDDLVVTRFSVPLNGFKIYLGQAAGGLADPVDIPLDSLISRFILTDLNSDSILDIAAADSDGRTLRIYIGNGAGGFVPGPVHILPTSSSSSTRPEILQIEAADADADGVLDLFVVATNGLIYVPNITEPPCLADVNGDGLVTPTDFTAWIGAFNTNAPGCDQNGDSACTPTDFTAWISNFNAGC